jgi:hypothetical protein
MGSVTIPAEVSPGVTEVEQQLHERGRAGLERLRLGPEQVQRRGEHGDVEGLGDMPCHARDISDLGVRQDTAQREARALEGGALRVVVEVDEAVCQMGAERPADGHVRLGQRPAAPASAKPSKARS